VARRRLPPLEASDFLQMLSKDGWYEVKGGNHRNFKHPTKPGKAQVSMSWTGVKPGSGPWKGICAQTGWDRAYIELLHFGK
jgi:predicted RNA binding protein YcfA (HicA-like mRNA interferase family)